MIDRDRLVGAFCDLVQIDSPSGEEEAVARKLSGKLESLGFDVARDGYSNVVAHKGEGDDPLILSAHMDTVEPGRGIKPSVQGDRIVSDGTTILGGDCKAGVSAIMEALESINEDVIAHSPVEVIFTREEEPGLNGVQNLDFSLVKGTQAIVFDGEGPASQITSASPTYVGFEVEITGRSAHAGMEPEKGLSAIRIAADMITKLPQGRLDGETTFNVGLIEGGQVRNAVPETAKVTGEFRSINLESVDGLRLQLQGVLSEVRRAYPDAVIEDDARTEFERYTLEDDGQMLQRVKDKLRGLGMEPAMRTSGGGTDGNVFRTKGIDAVVVGMAVDGMHTKQEYVTIPDLVDTAHLCEAMMRT